MNRRKLLGLVGLPSLLAAAGGAAAAVRGSRNPYYEGPVSANFDGLRFSDGRPITKGFSEFLRWKFQNGRQEWPESYPAPVADTPPTRVAALRLAHIGHASFLMQAAGLNLLIDPVFSERASPFGFMGPRRVNPPGVALADLPPVDVILLTHNHYDHMDMPALERLWERDRPRLVMPLGNDAILRERRTDWSPEACDWGARLNLSDRVAVTLLPSYHWSARGAFDRRMALWASFLFDTPQGRVYHVGDTGYHDGAIFRALRREFGSPRLAVLPIGAFEPHWFMRDNHMNPAEAVQVMQDIGAEEAIGHHWGTFQLTDEAIETPLVELAAALAASDLPAERFRAMQPGQRWQPAA